MKTHPTVLLYIFLSLFFLFSESTIYAQKDRGLIGDYVVIKMKDGNKITGKKLAATPESIVIEAEIVGKLNIRFSQISTIKVIRGPYQAGAFWKQNRNYMRALISPTGYGLEKGEGYYQNYVLFLNQAAYGLTDNFSIGVGVELFSMLSGLNIDGSNPSASFAIVPKFTLPVEEGLINVGVAGVLANASGVRSSFVDFGALYGVLTLGPEDRHLSLGFGFGISGASFSPDPIISLSGFYRLGNGIGIITENWFFPPGDFTVVSLGVRILGNRLTWDVVFVGGASDGFWGASPIPLFGVNIPFSR